MDISNHKYVLAIMGGAAEVKAIRAIAKREARRTKVEAMRSTMKVDEILDELEEARLQEVQVEPRFYGSSSEDIIRTRLR
jgi:hypothetical protein